MIDHILCWNVRGVRPTNRFPLKPLNLKSTLSSAAIVLLQETHLDGAPALSHFFPRFNWRHSTQASTRSGGVAIGWRRDLDVTPVASSRYCVIVKWRKPNSPPIYIGAIYIPPSLHSSVLPTITEVLACIPPTALAIVGGDLNTDLRHPTTSEPSAD